MHDRCYHYHGYPYEYHSHWYYCRIVLKPVKASAAKNQGFLNATRFTLPILPGFVSNEPFKVSPVDRLLQGLIHQYRV